MAPSPLGASSLPPTAHKALRGRWTLPVDPRNPSGGPGHISNMIRDDAGEVMLARAGRKENIANPFVAEATAMSEAVSMAAEVGALRVIFETDSKLLSEALDFTKVDSSHYAAIIEDTKFQLKMWMSKRRRRSEEGEANCHDRSGNKHKSLYLVLDDWHRGFTIRKLDAGSPALTPPPVVRLVSPARDLPMDFAALGGNIIATSNQYAATVVFDTETAALAMGNPLPDSLLDAANYFLTAGDALFAFAYYFMRRPQSFHVLTTTKDDMDTLCPSTD
ncbi:hypothetical protein TRIUR3_23819 [Triticum urartu]|uniref:RNase H type-1 domain-containing protein n=1 Tax=Triticum urartu TaxID=4572 RepID=M8AZP7_TRIUA|nr:hypothetical protein TRIUR3_23819 [Triticum urartu]